VTLQINCMNTDEIAAMAKKEIAEALGRPLAEITEDRMLFRDLGMESIDLIDLTFRFEKAMGKALSQAELFRSTRPDGDLTVADVIQVLRFVKS